MMLLILIPLTVFTIDQRPKMARKEYPSREILKEKYILSNSETVFYNGAPFSTAKTFTKTVNKRTFEDC